MRFRNPLPIIAAALVASAAGAQDIAPGSLSADLELFASGLTAPVTATHANDGSNRLFVIDQAGQIRIIEEVNGTPTLLPAPFLDISGLLPVLNPNFDERGLLGLAFHPNYQNNGRFFVRYSAPRTGTEDEPCFDTSRGCHKEVLAEYHVSSNDPNSADPLSARILLEVDEPQFNHNAGHVAFGPDGMLYLTFGDGGGANDSLDEPDLPHGPIGNGQNPGTWLGSMLRIDVDSPPDAGLEYAIPADNPFIGMAPAQPETWAYGFRNPYRFSFDSDTGRLFLGDVGQALFEEVNIVDRGGNYGWVIREGTSCFDPFDNENPLPDCQDVGPIFGDPLVEPIAEYTHDDGIAVVGGFVYRANPASPMDGMYFCGDYSLDFGPTGRLFLLDMNPAVPEWQELLPSSGPLGRFLLGIGQDAERHLYVLSTAAGGPSGTTGTVHRLVPPCSAADFVTPFDALDIGDVQSFLNAYAGSEDAADINGDGQIDFFDLQRYLNIFADGCP